MTKDLTSIYDFSFKALNTDKEISLSDLLLNFWRVHDPTQGARQGFDRGSQYRSGIYVDSEDDMAVASAAVRLRLL